jgi:hypothetical protein
VCARLRTLIEREASRNRKGGSGVLQSEGNITDNFDEVDANVHRIVENPLTESTGPNVRAEPLPEDVKWAQQKTSNRKSEESDS